MNWDVWAPIVGGLALTAFVLGMCFSWLGKWLLSQTYIDELYDLDIQAIEEILKDPPWP